MFQSTTIELGLTATTIALALAVAAFMFSLSARANNRPSYIAVARQIMYVNVALITLAIATIIHAFITKDFSVLYVAQNSNSKLPLIYRATALWGAHEGSLMLWLWYLTIFSALATYLHHKTHPLSMPYIIATLSAIQVAFLSFILFLSSPFTEVTPPLAEGRDLNPLLQDPGLIFHPPLLYMGYVGFSVPFAFAIAGLARGRLGTEWVVATRKWMLFSWIALTSGIMLGGYWSYYELGWGGYWAWDPVENASFMPWLTATALIHSVMAQERRQLFGGWNVFLIIATFSLSLMGTFLVRSGILTSVHAFAVDPGRGAFILAFLALVLLVSFGLFIWRSDLLKNEAGIVSLFSRESALLYNNLMFLVALFTVFLGTMLPLIAEFFTDERVTVGPPYFNLVMAPIMLLVLLLMAVGAVIPWRRASSKLIRKSFALAGACAIASMVILWAFGIHQFLALTASAIVMFAIVATLSDVIRAASIRTHAMDTHFFAGLWDLLSSNPRRYGGLIVHLGVLLICIGLIGSGIFKEAQTLVLAPGERFTVGEYTVEFAGINNSEGPNYAARQASLTLFRNDKKVTNLTTEKRSYPRGNMVTTEAAIYTTLLEDVYFVLGGETTDGKVSIRAYRNPLVSWIWIGWLVICIGTAVAFARSRLALPVRQEVLT